MFFGTLSTSIDGSANASSIVLGQRTATRKLNKVELLALLRPCDVRGDERVHECFKVWSPPLRKRVTDLPFIIDALACELRANWCQALVQPCLETFDLVVFGAQVVTWS
jgi:hypothetical protein